MDAEDTDAVLGDLVEQYAQGRSNAWYWRQVLAGVPIAFFKEVWSHKFIAIRAVLTGWAAFALFAVWIRPALSTLVFSPAPLQSPLLTGEMPFVPIFSYNFAASVALLFAAGAGCGWTIGLLDGSHRKTAILAYAASFLLIDTIFIGFHFFSAILPLYMTSLTLGVLTGGGIFGFSSRTARWS